MTYDTAAASRPERSTMPGGAVSSADVRYGQRSINSARLAALRAYAGRSILDVGCGSGAYVLALKDEYDIHGIDLEPFAAWSGAPERFLVGSATAIPHPAQSFDTVSCFEVIEHLADPVLCLSELHRVARQRIIITVPNAEITPGMRAGNLLYSHWSDPTHVQFFTKPDIERLVEGNGFAIVHSRYINPLNPWPFVLEASGLEKLPSILKKLVGRLPARRHCITTLIVADKI